MNDVKQLTKLIIDFRNQRDWRKFHKPKNLVISLMLEAGEVAEHFQWLNDSEASDYIKIHRKEIGYELADVLYWVLLMGHDFQIDLAKALEEKIKINQIKYPVSKSRGKSTKYTEL